MITSRQNKRERTPKGKGEIQLPKISRTLQPQSYYLDRYEWITRNTQYLLLSNPAIEQEQQYLNTELSTLNHQYTQLLKNINAYLNVKPLRKSKQTNLNDKATEIRDIQIQNNNTVISKLRAENQLLYRRISSVGNGKSQYDCAVIDIREKILKTKQKIKELKLRSKSMGQNIQSGQDAFVQLQRLQQEYKASQLKRRRLDEKLTISMANFANLQEKLQQINVQWSEAENWLSQHLGVEKASEQERNMDQQFKQRTYQLQITKKMIQSVRNTKQQKYLQMLRVLQEDVQKIKGFDKRLQKLQIKNLYHKKQLMQLQDLLSQTISLKKQRSKTSQKNEYNPQADQVLEFSQSKKQFSKYQIDLVKGAKNANASLQKIGTRKYFTNRLHSSNTKPVLLEQTKQLITQKDRLLNEVKAVNKTEIYDKKSFQSEIQLSQMTNMMKEVLPSNRNIFRTSRTKLKQQVKEKVKFQNLEVKEELGQAQKIVEQSIQYSPAKQEQEVNKQAVIDVLQPEKHQINEQIPQALDQNTNTKQWSQLERKKNLISNYVEQLEQNDQ